MEFGIRLFGLSLDVFNGRIDWIEVHNKWVGGFDVEVRFDGEESVFFSKDFTLSLERMMIFYPSNKEMSISKHRIGGMK